MRFLFTLLAGLLTCCLYAQPELQFVDQVNGLTAPTDITGSGDGSGRLFITEQTGRIRFYDQNTATLQGTTSPFLDITSRVEFNGGERGLLGLTFHPDFSNNGYFYVHYSANTSTGLSRGATVVSRFTAVSGQNTANTNTELVLFTLPQPRDNHNAGDLAFGPDGYLYFGLGDSGGGGDPDNDSQDFSTLLGKLLRIDVDNPSGGRNYGIPADNPYAAAGDGIPDEIYAIGLRNPWRISFDRDNGDLYIADVGQNAREEVNRQPAGTPGGQNYGWDCREGKIQYPASGPGSSSPDCPNRGPFIDPIFDYNRTDATGGKSITGGYVYRGTASDLAGYYVCADYISDNFFLYPTGGGPLLVQNYDQDIVDITTFGEDDNGELFVASRTGSVFRVTTLQAVPVVLTEWTATARQKSVELAWTTSFEEDADRFIVDRSSDGEQFSEWRTVSASNSGQQGAEYRLTDENPLPGQSFYRLKQVDLDGTTTQFGIRSVNQDQGDNLRLFPNPAKDQLFVQLPMSYPEATARLVLYDLNGRQVFDHPLDTENSVQSVRLPTKILSRGTYLAVVQVADDRFVRKLILR